MKKIRQEKRDDSNGYQLRHTSLGVYQGSCMGLGFWHPSSEMPEQGFCRFPTRRDAERYRDFLIGKLPHPDSDEPCAAPLKEADLSIEPFDKELDDTLILKRYRNLC